MKRLMIVALVLGLSPLLMGAGGGGTPPPPGLQVAKLPRFDAVVTIDVHNLGATSTAGLGSITVFGGSISTTGPVSMSPLLLQGFDRGCTTDPTLIQKRFVEVNLVDIMPSQRAVIELLAPLGAQVSFSATSTTPFASPVITLARFPRCAGPFDPADAGATGPGVQIFDAQIKLLVPTP
jgi:hypothetical protein